MMASKRNVQHSYVLMLVAIAVFAVNFVAVLSYLNYRSMVIEMEENLIARVERETISSMEVARSRLSSRGLTRSSLTQILSSSTRPAAILQQLRSRLRDSSRMIPCAVR